MLYIDSMDDMNGSTKENVKMLLNLTDLSAEPLHRQICTQLARRIIFGDIRAGEKLPSLRTLACEQHVSKATVERAYSQLAQEGLVTLRRCNRPVVTEVAPDERHVIAVRMGISANPLLDAIQSFSRSLASVFDIGCLSRLLEESLQDFLDADRVQVAVRDEAGGDYAILPGNGSGEPLPVSRQDRYFKVIAEAVRPLRIAGCISKDDESGPGEEVRSGLLDTLLRQRIQLIAPLRHGEEFLGFVAVGPRKGNCVYSSKDRDLLMIFADQFATALAMARLYVESVEKQRMDAELKAAQQIQADLLPEELDQRDDLTVAAFNSPSGAVGGDFYDYFPIDRSRTGFIIADACGHGMPAAMLVSQIQAIVKSEVANGNTIKRTLTNLNSHLHRHAESGFFATLFYGVLDCTTGTLEFANAGHDFPILVHRNGEIDLLKSTGPALGVVPHLEHETERIILHEGDCILLYTDGVTETTSTSGKRYGESQLRDLLIRNRHRNPREILEFIRSHVERFAAPEPMQDDRTVMLLRVNRLTERGSDAA